MPAPEPYLSTQDACAVLGISAATLRNWVRQGLVQAHRQGRTTRFAATALQALQARLQQGQLKRLQSRANKRWQPPGAPAVAGVMTAHGLDLAELLWAASLLHLCRSEAADAVPDSPDPALASLPANQQAEMQDWLSGLDAGRISRAWPTIRTLTLPDGPDPLGRFYTTLQAGGRRARSGAFYTPAAVAARVAADAVAALPTAGRILDPACGSGVFLLAAAQHLRDLSRPIGDDTLSGYDSDPIAVRLARLQLMQALPDLPSYRPHVVVADFLALALAGQVPPADLVIGNPPWGADLPPDIATGVARQWPACSGGESCAAFLAAALAQLQPSGRLAFLIPEALLSVGAHAPLRQHLVTTTTLQRLEPLGKLFPPVLSPVLCLETRNQQPAGTQRVKVGGERPHTVEQRRFAGNPDYRFDWWVTDADALVLRRVEAHPHRTLAGHADWALGIVTGDNDRHLLDRAEPDSEPIVAGPDVRPFRLEPARRFIRYQPGHYQQCAPSERYRAPEKLIYRFICDRLVVACDDAGHLTLNSANCLIPRLPDWPLAALAAVLNSTPIQALHRNRHHALKVLRRHLETLPVPLWPAGTVQQIAEAARPLVAGTAGPHQWEELDAWLMALWGLTPGEADRLRAQLVQRL